VSFCQLGFLMVSSVPRLVLTTPDFFYFCFCSFVCSTFVFYFMFLSCRYTIFKLHNSVAFGISQMSSCMGPLLLTAVFSWPLRLSQNVRGLHRHVDVLEWQLLSLCQLFLWPCHHKVREFGLTGLDPRSSWALRYRSLSSVRQQRRSFKEY
jgi:hypothetical protein